MKTAIIIPALNPDEKLTELVAQLSTLGDSAIMIIDDGSGSAFRGLFDRLETACHCAVVHHSANQGKGAALKTGIRLARQMYPGLLGVVTADADGQHAAEDIARVAAALASAPKSILLGTRDLTDAAVPRKSRWGNRITALVFRLCTRVRCPDTQTGLRGIPAQLFEFCLAVPGSRYEYEMNLLMAAAQAGIALELLPIATIYHDKNLSSHFRPVRDSIFIYASLLKHTFRFGVSSLVCAAVDVALFTVFTGSNLFGSASGGMLASTVAARCLSGILNFTLNKNWSFANRTSGFAQALMYASLFCVQMLFSWALVALLWRFSVNLTLLKMLADSFLFMFSYFIQRDVIFKNHSFRHGCSQLAQRNGTESRFIL